MVFEAKEETRAEHGLIESVFVPPRELVNPAAVRAGAERFSFLLLTCRPGTVPDPPLLAALLDLVWRGRWS